MRKFQVFWKIFLWANLLFILYFWAKGNSSLLYEGSANTLIGFGRLTGLLATYTVLLQFFFMGRTPYLERAFGLDKLARYHSFNGKLSIVFLLSHPVLLIWAYSSLIGVSWWAQYKDFIFNYPHVWWAFLGFVGFIVVIGTSIYIVRKHLRYESWYFVHLIVYLSVFGSYFHQTAVGADFLLSKTFQWYWIGLYTFVFVNHIVWRIFLAFYQLYKHKFYVDRIVRENDNTVSIYIKGNELGKFNVQPGQFMIFRFLDKQRWWQSHPFSLSMVPNGSELRITPKQLGDFTNELPQVKPGTKILIGGPYGVFTDFFSVSNKVLFIAGGIGITPIRSLMEQMLKKGKDVVLLYGNKTEKDIVFKDELEKLQTTTGGKVIHIISDDPSYAGEQGKLDEEKIKKLVPDYSSREVYLCGPPAMMEKLIQIFNMLGVKGNRLHYEKFSLH